MRYPPRLGHLATRAVIVARLIPTYAEVHQIDEEEAHTRLGRAVQGRIYEDLLAATWEALVQGRKRLDDEGLLEKIAGTLKDRPLRPGRKATPNAAWSAFLLLADLEAGTATESSRRVLETDQGRKLVASGVAEVGRFLAGELTRGK